jgi:glutamine synthetase
MSIRTDNDNLFSIMPTFMAKPHNGLPGCSGHIHVSLQDKNGKNIFALPDGQTRDDAKWDDLKHVSQECGKTKEILMHIPC